MKEVALNAPDSVLNTLKEGATERKRRSLDLIHHICKEQHERGSPDFSVATIGKLSAARGGPAAQPIRNAAGSDYRALIVAWAKFAEGLTRKPAAKTLAPSRDEDLINQIPDAVIRALVASRFRELTKLRGEVTLLKTAAKGNVTIDMRKKVEASPVQGVQVITPLDNLLKTELDAIRHALSDEHLNKMGWAIEPAGQIVTRNERRLIFKPGFATGLRKLLDASVK